MPNWSKEDAKRHTKKARGSDKSARAFSHAADSAAERGLARGHRSGLETLPPNRRPGRRVSASRQRVPAQSQSL